MREGSSTASIVVEALSTPQERAEFHELCEALSPGFVSFLKNPLIPISFKQSFLMEIFPSLSAIFFGLGNSLPLLDEICLKGLALLQPDREIATIHSAHPLTQEEREALQSKLSTLRGKEIVLKEILSPSLIDGMTIRVGPYFCDASLKTRLVSLSKILKAYP